MKILCLSDLHLYFIDDPYETALINHYKDVLSSICFSADPDCIVITGDIFEHNYYGNPYKTLRQLFDSVSSTVPIICCLGNHEFAFKTIDDTLKKYAEIPIDKRYNVHYLDVENSFKIDGYNFVGNVFWYDNTLKTTLLQDDKIVKNWLDSTIKNFIPSVENKKCQEQILANLDPAMKNILITHMVPHIDMNWFSTYEPYSVFNQYSGCKDFLCKLKDKNVIYSMCGHTHKRIMKEIYNINCVNVGNEYFDKLGDINYYVAEA